MATPGIGNGNEYGFPFPPYTIQKELIEELYDVLERGDHGIAFLESPTGTGKSLSTICGTCTWILDHVKKEKKELDSKEDSAGGDWVKQHYAEKKKEEMRRRWREYEERLSRLAEQRRRVGESEIQVLRQASQSSSDRKWNSTHTLSTSRSSSLRDILGEDEFLVSTDADDGNNSQFNLSKYLSDEEEEDNNSLMSAFETLSSAGPKVYYVSRTHTQLSQFIQEMSKTSFAVSNCDAEFLEKESKNPSTLRVIPLASRQVMCINESVRKASRGNGQRMNDICLDLLRNKSSVSSTGSIETKKRRTGTKCGCQYYTSTSSELVAFRSLKTIHDIEDIVKMGKSLQACPYFGARHAMKPAQLVVLPYQMLFHRQTRELLQIELEGNIVIVDEAHNLIDAMNDMYSVSLSLGHIEAAAQQLNRYKEKYKDRLSHTNIQNIHKILIIIKEFGKKLKFVGSTTGSASATASTAPSFSSTPFVNSSANLVDKSLLSINDFLLGMNLDNMNFFQVIRYVENSDIVRKLNGFMEYTSESTEQAEVRNSTNQYQRFALGHVCAFLEALTNADTDGRVVVYHETEDPLRSRYQFILLNPENHFHAVAKKARATLLLGGTLSPIETLTDALLGVSGKMIHAPSTGANRPRLSEKFYYKYNDEVIFDTASSQEKKSATVCNVLLKEEEEFRPRVTYFSCGHVIPADNLLTTIIGTGPTGKSLEYTYNNRSSNEMIDETGRALVNLCTTVPDGVVCFFPSYECEKMMFKRWSGTGIVSQLSKKKYIFRERKEENSSNDSASSSLLDQYTARIEKAFPTEEIPKPRGAFLSCVVGGKLSEGINFSDGLGRCIIVIGLPYASVKDPVLQEKLAYRRAKDGGSSGKDVGQEYYINMCMNKVNQSVGRAIRHRGDFAAVVLMDSRYSLPKHRQKLPKWIAAAISDSNVAFGPNYSKITKFFRQEQKVTAQNAFYEERRKKCNQQ